MSGIDGSRAALAVHPRQAGGAVHSARPNTGHRATPEAQTVADPATVPRVASARAVPSTTHAVGFLAQAIAQESLLLGARGPTADQRGPADLYRQTQDDAPFSPGQPSGIDLKI